MLPSVVSALLNRTPSYAHAPGEKRNRAGRPLPEGMWLISSEQQITPDDEEDIELHIIWLLDQIEPVKSRIDALRAQEQAQCDIFCTVVIQGNGGVLLTPTTLGRIAAMDLSLSLTVHYID